nr:hypothetical protein [Tanacetum cinerariifolium]
VARNQTNGIAGSEENLVACQDDTKKALEQEYILIPIYTTRQTKNIKNPNSFNIVSSHVNTVGSSFVNAASQTPSNAVGPSANDTGIFGNAYDDKVLEEEVYMNNVDSSYKIPEATKFLEDWKWILKKKKKQSPKRQNRTQNGKDRERQSHLKPKDKSQISRSTKVNPWKVKVKPGKVKVNPNKAEAEKTKKIHFKGLKLPSP